MQQPEEQEDHVWEALKRTPEIEVDPYFAKRVARAAEGSRPPGVFGWLFALPRTTIAGGVAAILVAVGLGVIALRHQSGDQPSPIAEHPDQKDAIEHGVAALDYIDYVDELVATEDPNLLSDADIIALLLDDGSAALLF